MLRWYYLSDLSTSEDINGNSIFFLITRMPLSLILATCRMMLHYSPWHYRPLSYVVINDPWHPSWLPHSLARPYNVDINEKIFQQYHTFSLMETIILPLSTYFSLPLWHQGKRKHFSSYNLIKLLFSNLRVSHGTLIIVLPWTWLPLSTYMTSLVCMLPLSSCLSTPIEFMFISSPPKHVVLMKHLVLGWERYHSQFFLRYSNVSLGRGLVNTSVICSFVVIYSS